MSIGIKSILLCSSAVLSFGLQASPQIDNISGQLNDKQQILLTGKGFGIADAAPLVWDTVDNQDILLDTINKQEVNTNLANSTWSENGSSWTTPMFFDSQAPKKGRSVAYAGGPKSYLKWPKALENENTNNIYVTWWLWVSSNPNAGGANKFIRIWDEADGLHTRISWTSSVLYHSQNEKDAGVTSWNSWNGNSGSWNRLEIWASGTNNTLKTWVNNKLTHKMDEFKKSESEKGLSVYLIGFDPSHTDKYPNFEFKLSDIYISKSLARVELSDKPTWSDPDAIKEIQQVTSWDSSSIAVNLNVGSFDNLSGKYIYVVDSTGVANSNGYPLCSKCPEPPAIEIN